MRLGLVLLGLLASALVVGGVTYAVQQASKEEVDLAAPTENPLELATGKLPQVAQTDEDLTHRFGEMVVNQELEYAFVVKNEGEGPLVLEGGGSTCKCTLADLETKTLGPGEQTEIKLSWKPPRAYDEFRQVAKVYTNQPDRETLLLSVVGQVLEEIRVEPGGVWSAGPVAEGETVKVGGHVYSPKYADFQLTEVLEAPDWLDVSWEAMDEAGLEEFEARSGYLVSIDVKPEMPLGRFAGQVRIGTNTDVIETIELGVTGSRAGPISILGPGFTASEMTLKLGPVKSSEGATRQLTFLVDKGGEEMTVDNVVSRPEGIVELDFEKKSSRGSKDIYTMTVIVPPGAKPGLYEREEAIAVDFETNQEQFPKVTMFVNAAIRGE